LIMLVVAAPNCT